MGHGATGASAHDDHGHVEADYRRLMADDLLRGRKAALDMLVGTARTTSSRRGS